MNIKNYVTRLDDYSGELTRNLATLEMAHVNGALSRTEQLSFVAEVQRAAIRRDLRPWRTRSIWAAGIGLGLLVVSGIMDRLLPHPSVCPQAFGLLGVLLLGIGGGCYMAYSRRRKSAKSWFQSLESAIQGGGSLFDLG